MCVSTLLDLVRAELDHVNVDSAAAVEACTADADVDVGTDMWTSQSLAGLPRSSALLPVLTASLLLRLLSEDTFVTAMHSTQRYVRMQASRLLSVASWLAPLSPADGLFRLTWSSGASGNDGLATCIRRLGDLSSVVVDGSSAFVMLPYVAERDVITEGVAQLLEWEDGGGVVGLGSLLAADAPMIAALCRLIAQAPREVPASSSTKTKDTNSVASGSLQHCGGVCGASDARPVRPSNKCEV
jgi:hypothetical protein